MIKKKKLIILILVTILFNFKLFSDEKAFIVFNVNDKIITNIDIERESKYLMVLNNQLKNLGQKQLLDISKDSSLREKIKELELIKYFDLEAENALAKKYMNNLQLRLKLKNEIELQNLLKSNGLSIEYVQKKIKIELVWNQLIYEKYNNQINIDITKLKKQIKRSKVENKIKIYLLSEIIFNKGNQERLSIKIEKIKESIKEIGFKNTANIYSVSDTAKFGGEIGWVSEKQLSPKIMQELTKLDVSQYTSPFQTAGSFMILRVDDIKYEKKIFDEDGELNKIIQFETDRQLERFSKIHYNKLKINTVINES
jgi:peptidyl-prolyl cis-trans isomerase SurA